LKSQTDLDAGGSEVSTSGMDEESSEADTGNGAGNGTGSRRGIVLEAVTGCGQEKYKINSKNVRQQTQYFLVEGL